MNESEIFEQAKVIRDRQERDAFLNQACGGDAALRKRLDESLASHDRATEGPGVASINQVPSPPMSRHQPTIELTPIALAVANKVRSQIGIT